MSWLHTTRRLEASLRKFSCLTIGDTICLQYNSKNFLLDVREVRPAPAACIIETDCEVDFEAPADYVPPPPPSRTAAQAAAASSDQPYGGVSTVSAAEVAKSQRGKALGTGGLRLSKKSGEPSATDAAALRAARLSKFESFHGTGQSLSGRTATTGARLGGGGGAGTSSRSLAAAAAMARTSSGVVVTAASADEETKGEEKEEEKKPVVPFQGEGRRLR